MNRLILLGLLGLLASPMAQAIHNPAVCKPMCTVEQGKCMSRAAKMTQLDKRPRLEEINPFARTADNIPTAWSEASVRTDQLAAQRRSMERNAACTATYTRCTAACELDLVLVTQPAAVPALPATGGAGPAK